MVGGVAVIVCSCAYMSRPDGRARSSFRLSDIFKRVEADAGDVS